MNTKTYYAEKKKVMAQAKAKLSNMDDIARLKLAISLKVSPATLHLYRFGNGNNFETALRILEA